MKKIKTAFYGAFSLALVAVPTLASAQWNAGLNNSKESKLPAGGILEITKQLMNWLLALVGFIGIIGFVIAGILYLTAAGDEDRIEMAKRAMMYSIIGVIVALIGFVIIQAVTSWLGGSSTSF